MSSLIKPLTPGAKTAFDLATAAVAVFSAFVAVGAVASSLIANNLPGEPLAPLSRVAICMATPIHERVDVPAGFALPVSAAAQAGHVQH